MFRVIQTFTDLRTNTVYRVGDAFPHEGITVSKERIAELSSNANKMGVPVIEEIKVVKPVAEKNESTETKGRGKRKKVTEDISN